MQAKLAAGAVALIMAWIIILLLAAATIASFARADDDLHPKQLRAECFTNVGTPTALELERAAQLAEAPSVSQVRVIQTQCWPWPDYVAVYYGPPEKTMYLPSDWRERELGFFVLVHELRHHRQAEQGTFYRLGPYGRECDAYEHTANVMIQAGQRKHAVAHRLHGRLFCAKFIAEELAR